MKDKGLFKLVLFLGIIALTGISCGVADIGNIFVTETSTPTSTYTPTSTFTPSPTFTSTPTITPTSKPLPTGVTSEEQTDGSTLFVDYDNKFQLTLPSGWIVIPLDQDGLAEMLDNVSQSNPDLADTAQAFRDLDADVFRMAALYTDRKLLSSGFGTNITVTSFKDETMSSMPLSFVTGLLEQSFVDSGNKVLTQGVNTIENDNGIEVEYLDVEQSSNGVKVVQRMVVFQTQDALIVVTITVPAQFKDDVLFVGDSIGGSVEFLK